MNDLWGAEAEWRPAGRLQAQLCLATGASATLDGPSPRPEGGPVPRGSRLSRSQAGAREWGRK